MKRITYGNISDKLYEKYKNRLINSIYKILPMKEEDTSTIETYIESLVYELTGIDKLFVGEDELQEILVIIAILENLKKETNISIVKREVFRAIGLVKRM